MIYELSYITFHKFRDKTFINNKIIKELGISETLVSGVIKYTRTLRVNIKSINPEIYDENILNQKVLEMFNSELISIGKYKIIQLIIEYDLEIKEKRKEILRNKFPKYFLSRNRVGCIGC
jgi:hypothetical protein